MVNKEVRKGKCMEGGGGAGSEGGGHDRSKARHAGEPLSKLALFVKACV